MITIHDLLKDSQYKEFICKVPKLPPHLTQPGKEPWRLMVKLKGEHHWRTKRFATYKEAFSALKKVLPRAADATINCGAMQFDPFTRVVRVKGKYFINAKGQKIQKTKLITWMPKMPEGEFEEHYWCPYCRRPSVFKYFTQHHALPLRRTGGIPIDPAVLRCSICGASENIVRLRRH